MAVMLAAASRAPAPQAGVAPRRALLAPAVNLAPPAGSRLFADSSCRRGWVQWQAAAPCRAARASAHPALLHCPLKRRYPCTPGTPGTARWAHTSDSMRACTAACGAAWGMWQRAGRCQRGRERPSRARLRALPPQPRSPAPGWHALYARACLEADASSQAVDGAIPALGTQPQRSHTALLAMQERQSAAWAHTRRQPTPDAVHAALHLAHAPVGCTSGSWALCTASQQWRRTAPTPRSAGGLLVQRQSAASYAVHTQPSYRGFDWQELLPINHWNLDDCSF